MARAIERHPGHGSGALNLEGPATTNELVPVFYDDLRALARRLSARAHFKLLEPGAVVNEAYFRLASATHSEWSSRRHFFGAAIRAVRQVLADAVRRKMAEKRGGALRRVPLSRVTAHSIAPVGEESISLDAALVKLEACDARAARVVQLRFFSGFTMPEIALRLEVSLSTIERDWKSARAFMRRQLREAGSGERNLQRSSSRVPPARADAARPGDP